MGHKYYLQLLLPAVIGQFAHVLQCLHISGKPFFSMAFHILAELIKHQYHSCITILFCQLSPHFLINSHGVRPKHGQKPASSCESGIAFQKQLHGPFVHPLQSLFYIYRSFPLVCEKLLPLTVHLRIFPLPQL